MKWVRIRMLKGEVVHVSPALLAAGIMLSSCSHVSTKGETPPPLEIGVRFEIQLERPSTGQSAILREGSEVYTNDQLWVRVTSERPIYSTVFVWDVDGYTPLYSGNQGEPLPATPIDSRLPTNSSLTFDNQVGEEYLIVCFSQQWMDPAQLATSFSSNSTSAISSAEADSELTFADADDEDHNCQPLPHATEVCPGEGGKGIIVHPNVFHEKIGPSPKCIKTTLLHVK